MKPPCDDLYLSGCRARIKVGQQNAWPRHVAEGHVVFWPLENVSAAGQLGPLPINVLSDRGATGKPSLNNAAVTTC